MRIFVLGTLVMVTLSASSSANAQRIQLAPEFTGVLYVNVPAKPRFVVGISGRFQYQVIDRPTTNSIDLDLSREVKVGEKVDNTIGAPVASVRSVSEGNPSPHITVKFMLDPANRASTQYTVVKSDYGLVVQFRRN